MLSLSGIRSIVIYETGAVTGGTIRACLSKQLRNSAICKTENSNLSSSLTNPPYEERDAWKDYSLNACADSPYGGH